MNGAVTVLATAVSSWELAVFGLAGRLTFTTISQSWLRQAAKRFAIDELPCHRGDGAASVLRSLLAGVVRLSQSLRGSRPNHGTTPPCSGAATSNRSCTG